MTKKSSNHITVIGTGYVGLVTGACLSKLGHTIVCVDSDKKKIANLQNGITSFFEPGLSEMIQEGIKKKRLRFTSEIQEAIRDAAIIFICVGTPLAKNGEMDLSFVRNVARNIGMHMNAPKIVVTKSTIPTGKGNELIARVIAAHWSGTFDIASNPEFLREGSAISDFLNPDRIVIGVNSPKVGRILKDVYADIDCPKLVTTIESAEMIKYASNAFLATKISFINEIARICEKTNADVEEVARGMGMDKRIGAHYLKAGFGYGGSCLPKDVRSFYELLRSSGYDFQLLKSVIEVNESQKKAIVEKIKKLFPKQIEKKTIAMLGIAFKDNTDDVRESAAVDIAKQLHELGVHMKVYDPHAMENAKEVLPKDIEFSTSAYNAAKGADLVIIGAEWKQFQKLQWKKIKNSMKDPIIIDGRNLLDPKKMKKLGFRYIGIGRSE